MSDAGKVKKRDRSSPTGDTPKQPGKKRVSRTRNTNTPVKQSVSPASRIPMRSTPVKDGSPASRIPVRSTPVKGRKKLSFG